MNTGAAANIVAASLTSEGAMAQRQLGRILASALAVVGVGACGGSSTGSVLSCADGGSCPAGQACNANGVCVVSTGGTSGAGGGGVGGSSGLGGAGGGVGGAGGGVGGTGGGVGGAGGGFGGVGGAGGGVGGVGGSGGVGGTGGACNLPSCTSWKLGGILPLNACCSAANLCGALVDATIQQITSVPQGCYDVNQPGNLQCGCPSSPSFINPITNQPTSFPGCCRADGKCGYYVDLISADGPLVGCMQQWNTSSAPACTPGPANPCPDGGV